MDVRHPPNLKSCTAHVADPLKKTLLLILTVMLYMTAGIWGYATMGDPYAMAVEEARKIHDTVALEEARTPKKVEWVEDHDEIGDIDSIDEDEDELKSVDLPDQDFPTDKSDDEPNAESETKPTNYTLEAKLNKSLPSESLPSAGAATMIFFVITFHILFHLMCHWDLSFRTAMLYKPATVIDEGTEIYVDTLKHHGKPGLSPLKRNRVSGDLVFEFQRRKYCYLEEGEPPTTEVVGPEGNGCIVPVAAPITSSIDEYKKKEAGLNDKEVSDLQLIFGENRLQIIPPTIFTMWRSQMISPIPVFQIFCSVLWMLDGYWQFTFVTFFMIMMLEGGTAFQRLKTLGQLTKMSIKPSPVHVLRNGKWLEITSQSLVPGDVISVNTFTTIKKETKDGKPQPSSDISDCVPCDCLLMYGSAVVNEASLTGESTPAMKDAVPLTGAGSETLNIEGRHRIHTLFSGTNLLNAKPSSSTLPKHIPKPPNDGAICVVLRTGFGSSQGSLMQLIEFSTEGVSGDTKETMLALLLLLGFAIAAAVHVFNKGMEKGDRTTHELLIKSGIIISSVVPRQLPMQMALAVNTALMAMAKAGMMCTEPFRVPYAGKITHTLFDKTGTLTTDTLVPSGVVNNDSKTTKEKSMTLTPMLEASEISSIILGGCHSLVALDGTSGDKIVGDPIEVAALRGVEWRYDAKEQTARRGNWEQKERSIAEAEKEIKAYKSTTKRFKELTLKIGELQKEAKAAKERSKTDKLSVTIKHRHHFSSQLQRMSVIAEISGYPQAEQKTCALVKGSPEAILNLLDTKEVPSWYKECFVSHMAEGKRVLALAYKWLPAGSAKLSRSEVEKDLKFAGFIGFSCRIRNDTSAVVGSLKDSDHTLIMVTGDGPLTALHVAKEVNICTSPETLVIEVNDDKVEWVSALGDNKKRIPYEVGIVRELAKEYNLMTEEENLEKAATILGKGVWGEVTYIQVFARMSPQGKAKVIRAIQQESKGYVLMCGDGSNDVGALKQADVGLALLSGYGNANTDSGSGDKKSEDEGMTNEQLLNKHQKELDEKAQKATAVRRTLMGKKNEEIKAKQAEWFQEELKKREERGEDCGVMGQFQAMQAVLARIKNEMVKEEREVSKVGNVYAPSLEDALAAGGEDSVMIRPGDASVAASFTSRLPTIKSTIDLIRQGRCTLLSALQQQQIMMLESVITAYTLSALSLEGARQSERQMLVSGWLLTIANLAFSYATPIDKMHPQRPLRSLFHPAIFTSIVGQGIIHVYCMHVAVTMSTEAMGPELLAKVVDFHRNNPEIEENDEDSFAIISQALWLRPFMPNLLNTVVFLVETSQVIGILFVNYKGRPWMKGILENHALTLSLFSCFACVAYVAWEFSPTVNEMFHFAPFPNDEMRWNTIYLISLSIFGTFFWDRLCTAIFSPHIFKIMLQEAWDTKLEDFIPVLKTVGYVVIGFQVLATSPLLAIGGYFLYKRMNKKELGD
eukprot:TRINITY_DN875_c3_g1_i1.p1 TRINITY_DN875_c3_g1~~TRINITY_DN875_c3_g1_i1.p1  ORF type:complete len:1474 (+),score=380.10 TRINITY_DN875_c3_g1_i1:61-4482(+)